MKISALYPSAFLRAGDLPDGRDVEVVISDVRLEKMPQSNEEKPVVYFEGKDRGLVLNVTNANTIAGVWGENTEAWYGQRIVLYSTTTDFGGKTVPCVRMKAARPAAPVSQPALAPAPQPALAPQETSPVADNSDATAIRGGAPF